MKQLWKKIILMGLILLCPAAAAFADASYTQVCMADFTAVYPFEGHIDKISVMNRDWVIVSLADDSVSFESHAVDPAVQKKYALPDDLSAPDFLEQWRQNILNSTRLSASVEAVPERNGVITILQLRGACFVKAYRIDDNRLYDATAELHPDRPDEELAQIGRNLIDSIQRRR